MNGGSSCRYGYGSEKMPWLIQSVVGVLCLEFRFQGVLLVIRGRQGKDQEGQGKAYPYPAEIMHCIK